MNTTSALNLCAILNFWQCAAAFARSGTKRSRRRAIAVLSAITLFAASAAPAAVRYVDANNNNPVSPFTNWTSAAANIQDAIDVADAGDMILVTNGTYAAGGREVFLAMTNRVVVDKAVTVQSVNGPATTVIQGYPVFGDSAVRCVSLADGAVLSGFTLTNGATRTIPFPEYFGGGAWCETTNAVLTNCVITGNAAYPFGNAGGGVYRGTLNNCLIVSNSASGGGGVADSVLNNCVLSGNQAIYCGGASGGILDNCVLSNNLATSNGGGAGSATLNNCRLIHNTAADTGGGVDNGILNNCVLVENSAHFGGGANLGTLFMPGALNNCLLLGNSAVAGGGVYANGSVNGIPLLNNCTIVSNSAPFGAGINGGRPNNCIIYYNTGDAFTNYFVDQVLDNCCTWPLPPHGSGNITNEPLFLDLANGNLKLHPASPCINSGFNAFAPAGPDLEGNPRIAGGTVDIGAYEFQSPTSIISYAWLQQYGLLTDGSADFADSDGDHMNNWQEWIAGSSPIDPLSRLLMFPPVVTNNPAAVIVSWQSVAGRNYFLQRSSDLIAPLPFTTVQSNIVGQIGQTTYSDTNVSGSSPFFYRVGVEQ